MIFSLILILIIVYLDIRPIVTNINQPPLIRSSILNDPPLPESNGTTSTKPDTVIQISQSKKFLIQSLILASVIKYY